MSIIWERVVAPKLRSGIHLESRTGASYSIITFDENSFTLQRPGTGSLVKITKNRIEKNAQRLLNGELLLFQKNPKQGGISYTVAEEVGVVWALGNTIQIVSNGYIASPLLKEVIQNPSVHLQRSPFDSYLSVSENIQVSPPSISEQDPDASGKGWSLHNKTQNELANFLIQNKLEPLKALRPPLFDIAWKRERTFFVGEVKSITVKNEEAQLRRGLGQVLRYCSQLEFSNIQMTQPVLITSTPVRDTSWVRTCNFSRVLLTWPGNFQTLLS